MARKVDELTAAALAGYRAESGEKNPHLYSSAMWFLFESGKYMNSKGFSTPIKAKMSRGYSVRVETVANVFILSFRGPFLNEISHERR